MKISIIVPVYNLSQYIVRCFNSIKNQTYKNFECIFVEDGSTDTSLQICRSLIAEYNGEIDFKLLCHEHNKGLSAARNTGTEHSTGDYIYYLDGDDEITPDCMQSFLEVVTKFKDAEIIVGQIRSIPYLDKYNLNRYNSLDYIDNNLWIRKEFYKVQHRFPVYAWNKLIKREFLLKNKLYFKDRVVHEDQLWMFYVSKVLNRIAFVHHETYIHYYNSNSIMNNLQKHGHIASWNYILSDIVNNFDEPCKKEQILTYLHAFLNRTDELSSFNNYHIIFEAFEDNLKRLCLYSPWFVLWRLKKSRNKEMASYCIFWLQSYCKGDNSKNILSIIKFEIDMLRVRFSLSGFLKG